MGTRTGNFAIGFRRGWSEWQKNTKGLAHWAKASGFDRIDLGNASADELKTIRGEGIEIGSADVLDFGAVMANDPGKRKEVIAKNVAYIKEASANGAKVFFTCMCPGDGSKKRSEIYALAVESFGPIAKAAADAGAKLAIEGWPGGGNLPNPGCNPETYRAFLKDLGTKGTGINYDPSHLIRMGIDHIRFLQEFAPHVVHVHGKDTEIFSEAVYEYGLYQGASFANGHGFGEYAWRYTIPGHGCARFPKIFSLLKDAGFKGAVCVELEDENFNTNEDGEKAGLLHSLNFLISA